jgi:hypothetical protein
MLFLTFQSVHIILYSMPIYLKNNPNSHNSNEKGSLSEAVGAMAESDTLYIEDGQWPGTVVFPKNPTVIGTSQTGTVLLGVLTFSDGGNITKVYFPPKSQLVYLKGIGVFKDLLIDSDLIIGPAIVTGDNIHSSGQAGAKITSQAGASMILTNSTFGAMANAGVAQNSLGVANSFRQSNGVSQVSQYAIAADVVIESGISTFSEVVIGKSLQVKPSGKAIIKKNCIVK